MSRPLDNESMTYANEERNERIKYLRNVEKWTLQQIADQFNTTRQNVSLIVGNTGFIGLQHRVEQDRKCILELDDQGYSRKEIANQTGFTYAHVCTVLLENGRRLENNRTRFLRGERKCYGDCGLTLPISEFGSNKSDPDGLMKTCKVCNRANAKKYRG